MLVERPEAQLPSCSSQTQGLRKTFSKDKTKALADFQNARADARTNDRYFFIKTRSVNALVTTLSLKY